jgi:hypothetical protein
MRGTGTIKIEEKDVLLDEMISADEMLLTFERRLAWKVNET